MVKLEELQHTFCHPWKSISLASWLKYPNSSRPDVLAVDLIKKDFDAETGILYTTRLLTVKSAVPSWLEKIIGVSPYAYCIEEACIDPKNNRMVLKARNLSFDNLMRSEETCVYTPHPQNTQWTLFSQTAKITAFPFGLKSKIEDFCIQHFKQNSSKGREIMEQAIDRIQQEFKGGLSAVEESVEELKGAVVEGLKKTEQHNVNLFSSILPLKQQTPIK